MTSQTKSHPKIDYGVILTLILLMLSSLIVIYSAQTTCQYGKNFVLLPQVMWCSSIHWFACRWIVCVKNKWPENGGYFLNVSKALFNPNNIVKDFELVTTKNKTSRRIIDIENQWMIPYGGLSYTMNP